MKVTGDDLTKMSNWIEDIQRNDYPNNSTLLQQTNVDLHPIPVSSALISKKTNIFQGVKVSADELPKMSNCLDEMDPNGEPKIESES